MPTVESNARTDSDHATGMVGINDRGTMSGQHDTRLDTHRFAIAIVSRLAEIVPTFVSVTAVEDGVLLSAHGRAPSVIHLFQAPRPLVEQMRLLATNVLSAAQDVIARETGAPWPPVPGRPGHLPLPDAAVRDGALVMWYGDADAPVVRLRSLALMEVLVTSA